MTDNIVYDTHFNGNEWLVIGLTVIGLAAIRLFPRSFSPMQTTFNMLIGITFGLIFDHTIGIPPFDLYDFGDQAKYQFFDIISYAMYMPFGYWFIFGYERFRIRGFSIILYILVWALLGISLETVGVKVGQFHYKDGYRLAFSFPIYLLLLSAHLGLYRLAFSRARLQKKSAVAPLEPR
ncbi:hypothetical protein [Paenibacillus hamazuiensis]|uniref:hypothetical protein n=1 Tax=Paenibacillus hamazuiensis TaxID=2936508 RepID=UPI00200FEFC9|nr:hypothetical protein [Paenibacillus hamazuiensis]